MTGADPVAETLAALGFPPGELPRAGALDALHLRFSGAVPYHPTPPRARHPREVLAAWLETGAGTSGGERSLAFAALARALGLAVTPAGAVLPGGRPHALLLVESGRGPRALVDPALPVPAVLPLEPLPVDLASPIGRLSVVRKGPELELVAERRGAARTLLRTALAPVTDAALAGPGAPAGLPPGALLRFLEDRTLAWSGGRLTLSDAWSRLELPVSARDASTLAGLFGEPLPAGVEDATPEPPAEASLTAYHAVAAPSEELLARLRSLAGHRARLEPGALDGGVEPREDGFCWTLRAAEGELLRGEEVRFLDDGAEVTLSGPGPVARKRYRVEPADGGGSRLSVRATLAPPVPVRGPNDGTRRTLVFLLVSELVALARDGAR